MLCLEERKAKGAVVSQRLEPGELTEVGDPAIANGISNDARERGIRQQQPASWGDPVGLVTEPFRKQTRQIFNGNRAEELGMDRRNTIRAMRADNRQVRHANLPSAAFIYQAYTLNHAFIARKLRADGVKQAAIDLEHDLKVPRQHLLKPRKRPFLQRLRKQSVVCVSEGPLSNAPRSVPAETLIVEQNSHQLRNGQSRMRIVELNGDLLGKRGPFRAAAPKAAHQIRQRAGHQEVLLHKAQSLPHAGRVIRIENSGKRFRFQRLGHGADEVAVAECLKIEKVGRCGRPKSERINVLAAVTHYRPIKRNSDQSRWTPDDRPQGSSLHLERAV